MTDALIDGERGAQVVGHGLEESAAQLVRFGERDGFGGLGVESAAVEGGGEVGGEGVEHAPVLAGEVAAGQGEHEVVAYGVDLVGIVGCIDAGAVGGFDGPAVVGSSQQCDAGEPEGAAEVLR